MGAFVLLVFTQTEYPKFWTRIFKSHLLPTCVRFWLISVHSARKEADEKIKKKIDRIVVGLKPKSADDYVGRPNSLYRAMKTV